MKLLTSLTILVFLIGCSSPKTEESIPSETKTDLKEQTPSEKADPKNDEVKNEDPSEAIVFQISTYDNPEFADQVMKHQASLKGLSDNGVFSMIQDKLFQKLAPKHTNYFKSKQKYELLALAKGNLFRESKTDCGFIVYDKTNRRIAILIYRETTNKYAELFRDLKVENGLENAACNYSSFGTIDYQIAEEIIYMEEYLLKKPEIYLDYSAIKITDISKDEDFFLKEGCFSKSATTNKKETANSLGLATSYVYNNWEALRYNEKNNSFVIFYGQAFAD